MTLFVYDLPRLVALHREIADLTLEPVSAVRMLEPLRRATRLGVLSASFNPLTRAHVALVEAGLRGGVDAVLLLLPLRAVDKEDVTRAAAYDRALVASEWARRHERVAVGLANRGLYVEQAALLEAAFPGSAIVFLIGYDKVLQILDPRYYQDREASLDALFMRASLAVAPRLDRGRSDLDALMARIENRRFATRVEMLEIDTDVAALSSTQVREAARSGQAYDALVPPETTAFLAQVRPYDPPRRLPDGETVDDYGLRLALVEAAAAGRLDDEASFEQLSRVAREPSPEGRRLRAALSHSGTAQG